MVSITDRYFMRRSAATLNNWIESLIIIIIPGSHKKNPLIKLIISGFNCLLLLIIQIINQMIY